MENSDYFTQLPLIDIVSHPICKAFRWDEKEVKRLIREGRLEGKINSRGEGFLSLMELYRISYMNCIDLVIKHGIMDSAAKGEPSSDFDIMLLHYLLNKLFGVGDISIGRLHRALKSAKQ